jgi:predicted extracellular nuclease
MRALAVLILLLLSAPARGILISEYVEGNGNNQAIELYNPAAAPRSITNYVLQIYASGSAVPTATITLSGTLAAGGAFVIVRSTAGAALLATADATSASLVFSGDDAIVLVNALGTVIDRIGRVGEDPGNQWGTGQTSTQNNVLRRTSVAAGPVDPTAPFVPSTEWQGFNQNDFTDVGAAPVALPEASALGMLGTALVAFAATSPLLRRGPRRRRR